MFLANHVKKNIIAYIMVSEVDFETRRLTVELKAKATRSTEKHLESSASMKLASYLTQDANKTTTLSSLTTPAYGQSATQW